VIAAALVLSFLLAGLIAGASAGASHRAWADRPLLAPVYAVLGLGLVAHVSWIAYWVDLRVGIAWSLLVVAAASALLVRQRFWRSWRDWGPVTGLTACVGLVSMGLAFLYGGSGDPLSTLTYRFLVMPSDNVLQHLFADRLWRGGDLSAPIFLDYHGSDRPPLQSGLLLLVRPFGVLLGVDPDAAVFDSGVVSLGLASSVVAQLIWVPVVHSLVRVLGRSQRTASVTVLFCAITPVVFTNTIFTWPKLVAGGFGVGAVVLLADMLLTRRWSDARFASAAALAMLSFLSHGTTAFAAPLFVGLGLAVLRRTTRWAAGRGLLVAGACSALLYLPWELYGTFVDPFTNRLAKWHLAGVVVPNDSGFGAALRHGYATTPVSDLIATRLSNLKTVFDVDPRTRLTFGDQWLENVRYDDFFHTSWALGWGCLLAVWMTSSYLGSRVRRRRGHGRHRARDVPAHAAPEVQLSAQLVLLSAGTVLFWTLIMFLPGGAVVHQGSLVWILLLLSLPFAWCWDHHRRLAGVITFLTGMWAAVAYASPSDASGRLSPIGAATLLVGLALLVACAFGPGSSGRLAGASAERRTRRSTVVDDRGIETRR
jgi:hypothetical protein